MGDKDGVLAAGISALGCVEPGAGFIGCREPATVGALTPSTSPHCPAISKQVSPKGHTRVFPSWQGILSAQRLVASLRSAPQYFWIRGTGGCVTPGAPISVFQKVVGGALEGGSSAAHEMPLKQFIQLGHPPPLGQPVASEQLDMASS
jgi:hypothetical protein